MKPNRILPDLQCSLMCEDVRQESSGNFILVGVLGLIRVPQVPIFATKVCVFNRWVAGVGQFTEVTRLLAPDGSTVVRQNTVKFQLNDPAQAMTTVSVMQNLEFAQQGVYTLEILVDDVMKLRVPLPVMIVQPPPGQGAPAPGQAPAAPAGSPAQPEPGT
jgi:hypothetical protein